MATAGPPSEADPSKPAAGTRKFTYLLLSLYLPAVAMGLGQGITTPVLPVFVRDEFNVSVALAANLFVAQMLGGLIASVPVGYAIDRFGRRRILLAGPVIVAATLFLTATASAFWMLLVYRFIAGFGQQMWMLSRLTVIADGGGGSRGRQITSMFGIERIGLLAGPLIGGFVAEAFGVRVPFVIHGVVALLAVVPSFLVIQETNPGQRKKGEARNDAGFSWKMLLKHPILILYTAQLFSTATRGGAIGGGTVFLFGAYAYGVEALDLAFLSSATALIGIPLTLSAGVIMDRFGRKVTVVPGLTLFGFVMVWFAATAYFGWGYWAFVSGFVAMQVLGAALSGSMQTIGTDFAPAQARGGFFGIGRMVSQAGFMTNPLSFSFFVWVSGNAAAFAFLAGTGVASALILAFLIKESLLREKDG